jgi:hypothetical protein
MDKRAESSAQWYGGDGGGGGECSSWSAAAPSRVSAWK